MVIKKIKGFPGDDNESEEESLKKRSWLTLFSSHGSNGTGSLVSRINISPRCPVVCRFYTRLRQMFIFWVR